MSEQVGYGRTRSIWEDEADMREQGRHERTT
jgi:hypothetical protein